LKVFAFNFLYYTQTIRHDLFRSFLWRAIGGRGPEDVLRPSGGRETVPPKQHKVQ
jgi:hypothetical protein